MPELAINDQLMQRIRQESKPYLSRPPQEGEFTYRDYMEINDVSYTEAIKALQQMEADGKVEVRNEGRGKINIFKFVESEE